eukprot:TRINITY_DN9493_c0_g1_i5.p1 TRINITY_DN9493_c0_g1~~TRINITY_DN9493_c0_g1_i5.p1  ORF type:complete len:125 (+),score=21.38 TRINITY_DN9493_c0_g1_i5:48-422(+)
MANNKMNFKDLQTEPLNVSADQIYHTRPQAKIVEESDHYRTNKHSISWAIGDSQTFALQEKTEQLKARVMKPLRPQSRNRYKEKALREHTIQPRAESAASNYSGPSNLTREEEDIMNDIFDDTR